MKTRVSLRPVVFAALNLALLPLAVGATQSDIAPATQRQAANQQAAQLVAKPASAATPATKPATTPFSPAGFDAPTSEAPRVAPAAAKDAEPAKPMTPYETVRALGAVIQVKGSMTVGGVRSLTIKSADRGQIVAKVGDKVTVPLQGSTYEVRIVSIQATSYTIEWNGEKLTRPIGSAR